jgi:hypothetical protein
MRTVFKNKKNSSCSAVFLKSRHQKTKPAQINIKKERLKL